MDTKKLREFDPEFAEKLKRAVETGEPVTVTIDERVVTLTIAPEPRDETDGLWGDYDPERVRVALENLKPIFTDEEADELIDQIYKSREAGTRPINRP